MVKRPVSQSVRSVHLRYPDQRRWLRGRDGAHRAPRCHAHLRDLVLHGVRGVRFSVAGSGPVPVLEVNFRGLRTEDRTGPPLTTRTGTGTAVLIGPRRTAVRSSVRTGPGLHSGPDQSRTSPRQSRTSPLALGNSVLLISPSFSLWFASFLACLIRLVPTFSTHLHPTDLEENQMRYRGICRGSRLKQDMIGLDLGHHGTYHLNSFCA